MEDAGTPSGSSLAAPVLPRGVLKYRAQAETDTVGEMDEEQADFFPEEEVGAQEAEALFETQKAEEEAAYSSDEHRDLYEDPAGSMYAGPLATSVPTSMTTMRRRSRSKSVVDRSDVESDDGSAVYLASSARSNGRLSSSHKRNSRRPSNRRSTSARSSRRGSVSSAASKSREDVVQLGSAKRKVPVTAVESASDTDAEEDEEGGKKPKRKGLLSAFFGSRGTPQRPSMERASSSASFMSKSTRRSAKSGTEPKKRKGHRRRTSSISGLRGERDREEREQSERELEEASDDEVDENDPYGLYGSSSSSISTATTSASSNSSASTDDGRSRRYKRRAKAGGSMFLGSMSGGDPLFGDGRSDVEETGSPRGSEGELSEDEEPFFLDEVTATRQTIYIPDEDLQILFEGWGEKTYKTILWTIGCILSLGALSLLGKWIPEWWLSGRGKTREFGRASKVVVKTSHGTIYVVNMEKLVFASPVAISTIFPPTSLPPPTSRNESLEDSVDETGANTEINGIANALASSTGSAQQPTPASGPNGTAPPALNGSVNGSAHPTAKTNGSATPADQGSFRSGKEARLKEFKYVDFRYYRFLLHPGTGNFYMSRDWRDPNWTTLKSLRGGITDAVREDRKTMFDQNTIEIEARTIGQLLMDEVLHPFYIFQIASIILWSLDDYYFYAVTIALISVLSISTTLIETRNNVERMREMSRFVCTVRVWRKSIWELVDSSELVPGDLVDLSEESMHTFPADLILLSGDAIVNESMLTGESVPVSKVPVDDAGVQSMTSVGGDVSPDLGKHFLFCGTRIVRIRKTESAHSTVKGGEAVGMVVRTGFNTTKGALVRSMLFPKPMGFKFYRDSFRFIGVLACIAGLGFLGSAFKFVELGIKWQTILIRALDLVTIVVPPALPATMSIGTSFAITRLRKKEIFCISPNRVNIGGKINLVCFDKTGTLTEEGLDVLGIRSVDRTNKRFSELYEDVENVPIVGAADAKTPLTHALATCHGLKLVNGEVIGDPLDLRMFEFTRWTLEEGKESSRPIQDRERKEGRAKKPKTDRLPDRPATLVQSVVRPPGGESFKLEDALRAGKKHAHFLELGVIRTFDFVSSLRRMSVLVKKLKSQTIEAYVKGAPEVMLDICTKESLPEDYAEILENYTRHGYRVIAIAAKSIPALTWVKAQRLKREEVESDLRFLGLIVFENKLKPGTGTAIRNLLNAHIPCRMVTGDNIRTAVSVARECGMVNYHDHVYMPTFKEGDMSTPKSIIEWNHVEDERLKLDPYSLKPTVPVTDDGSLLSFDMADRAYHLAVSGDVFRWMIDYASNDTLHRLLIRCVIYARMSPDEKHEIVERLQHLGYTVGFCGDGANDCGALKAADVGLSLSEAEASVAAPFTSRSTDIGCFLEVIREGRAALVTSFSCFKFMALYSLIQFTTVTLLYSLASSLGDFQFLYIDLAIIIPIAITMGRTEPFQRIVPKRPTANLVSKKVLTSLLGQIVLTSGLQLFVFLYVRTQPWYEAPVIDPDQLDTVSYENSALFLISSFQYIIVAVVFCVGPPYRKPIHSNILLLLTLVVLAGFSTYTVFVHYGVIFNMLGLVDLPREFQLELFLLALANTGLSWAWEKHLSLPVASQFGQLKRRWRRWRGSRRVQEGKLYKLIERDMED